MYNKLAGALLCLLLAIAMLGCGGKDRDNENAVQSNEALAKKYRATMVTLSDSQILVDGNKISDRESDAVYADNDIVFYLEGQGFTYGQGTEEDEHSEEEAAAHTVVHITRPGNYVISGTLSKGQIAVDLGKDADENRRNVVTLIFNNADISCSVAPGVIFYNVYECDSHREEKASREVDTTNAGANVILADGSVNRVNASYVAKIYKSIELNEDGTKVENSKKLHKYDGAFYSKMSMNIGGEEKNTGVLYIHGENEGLSTELHLTINGGNIHITSGDDGINANEEAVSVITINGGNLNVMVDGSTGEGDGIDSNGWVVINGGTINSFAYDEDFGIDSDKGIYIDGGNICATGSFLEAISESKQNYVIFTMMEMVEAGSVITVKNESGEICGEFQPSNDFMYMLISSPDLQQETYTVWKEDTELSIMQQFN